VRICLISFEFLPKTGFGGAAALYTDLANALVRLGHEVVVLSGNDTSKTETEIVNGFTNLRFGHRRLRPRPLACMTRSLDVLRHYSNLVKRTGPFSVVESPELAAEPILINAIRKTCPSVTRLVTPHFLLHKMNERRRFRTVDWLERDNANLSDVILGDSRQWAEDIMKEWKISLSKLRICPLGIDLQRIDSVRQIPTDIGKPYVLYAGRLTLAKGPQILAMASPWILKEHPEVKIVFAGGDTLSASGQSVRGMVESAVTPELRKSFLFKGFIKSWDELVNLYRNASVCVKADVYTNHSYDTMGQLACGRPLVCTKNEAHMDMIEDQKNGFLFDREDPRQLATIINKLLSDPALCKETGKQARRTVETRFTSSICASESIKVYSELTGL
jgi:glycosyltransferase involved in cell wall biosynthesis